MDTAAKGLNTAASPRIPREGKRGRRIGSRPRFVPDTAAMDTAARTPQPWTPQPGHRSHGHRSQGPEHRSQPADPAGGQTRPKDRESSPFRPRFVPIEAHADPAEVIERLPRPRFVGLLKRAGLIVGNSSTGLIEAAACRCAAVDVGPRQGGRERPAHAHPAEHGPASIRAAIVRARAFRFEGFAHPYGDGRTGERVAELLATISLATVPLRERNSF